MSGRGDTRSARAQYESASCRLDSQCSGDPEEEKELQRILTVGNLSPNAKQECVHVPFFVLIIVSRGGTSSVRLRAGINIDRG